jgi:exonuclease VII large subunit
MDTQLAQQQQDVLTRLSEKNAEFFELEMEKLEGWAGDLKESLEHELKEIDREIKETKREAQLAASLESKVALHKRIKDLESRRAEKRRGLFEAQDAVDTRKDSLLSEIEARLTQALAKTELFTVKWKVE